jgi:hypothetical protein
VTRVEKPKHLPQGGRRKKRRKPMGSVSFGNGSGQIRPVPRKRDACAVLAEEQNPGLALTPEDLAHPSLLTTVGALLSYNGESSSSQCKIGRSLFRG